MSGIERARISNLWEREPDNWYVEPEWCSERLFAVEPFDGKILDPCAGTGRIAAAARAAGYDARATDIRGRAGYPVEGGRDFFTPGCWTGLWPVDNIVSNPPYGKRPDPLPGERGRYEEEFLRLALKRTRRKVALFMDANWLNSSKRGEWIETLPLYRVWLVGPRPACPPGPFLENGGKAGNGRTDYAWYVFLHGFDGSPTLGWLRRDG